MTDQKVAKPSRDDVLRVAAREFPEGQTFAALNILNVCGLDEGGAVRDRIHAAALRLARGDLERLRQFAEIAKSDPRDVIAPAEYPRYLNAANPSALSMAERKAILDADWTEYQAWLSA